MRKILSNFVEGVAVILVVALAVVVFLQVFNRYVLKAPLAWSEDLAMLLFQWVTFLGAAIGVRRMRHFGIELVVRNLPEKIHRAIEYIIPVLVGIVALIMVTEGIELLSYNRSRIYSSMNLSYTWAYLPIPISGCLMIIYLIRHEVTRWQKRGERRAEK
jgi:TRAP-type C4-dicarboxylate transport system permease small subunit